METWQPHDYQKDGVRWLLQKPEAALFWRPGLGKSAVTLRALVTLLKTRTVDRCLVLAPLSVAHAVWPAEARKWSFAEGLRVEVLHGPRKGEALRRPAEVQVMNYEGLPWLCQQARYRWPRMLVLDELTKVKHPRTQRFRLLRGQLGRFHRRVGLTGTPAPNGLMDLFGEIYALDLGQRLGAWITRFRMAYFTEVAPHEYLPHPDAEERIREKLRDLAHHVDDRALRLPRLVETRVPVQLPEKARRTYAQLEATFLAQLEEGTVTAANAGVLAGKLRQVAGGAVYGEGERSWHAVHEAKVEALLDRLEESGEPTLVAYAYDHERERIAHALDAAGIAWAHLGGAAGRRRRAIEAWNAGALRVLLGHPQTFGHGLNLQAGGRRFVWFGPTWDLEHHIQAVDRLHRQGQKRRVFVDTLVAEDTIEEVVLRALAGKARTQAELLAHLTRWRKAA